jgi:hypothetical protein
MICSKCGATFHLLPGKSGYANVCQNCTESPELHAEKAARDALLRKQRAKAETENRRRTERDSR